MTMMSDTEVDLIIDEEFKNLLPAPTEEEYEQLKKNCMDCGVLSPLVAWVQYDEGAATFTLIDGHTRYRICQEEALTYNVTELGFESRAEVLQWIYENQRGRRNWSPERESYVRGMVYNEKKGSKPGRKVTGDSEKQDTSIKIAKESGVSPRTVQRDGDYAKGVNRIAEKAPELKAQILDGGLKASKRDIEKLATAPEEKVEEVVNEIKSGKSAAKKVSEVDEVLFGKLESAVGIIARLTDELAKRHGESKIAQAIIDYADAILKLAGTWQEDTKKKEFKFLDVPKMSDGEFE